MASLEQKYPQLRGYINDSRKLGFGDTAIEKSIRNAGHKPQVGSAFDSSRDSSFLDVMSEKFTIEPDESFLNFIGDVVGIPQAVATAGISQIVGAEEGFLSQVSRGIRPSEFLPTETPGAVKFLTDVVADPLNLTLGLGLFSKISKGLKTGSQAAKGIKAVGETAKIAEEVTKVAKPVGEVLEQVGKQVADLADEGLAMNLSHVNPKVQSAIRDTWKEAVEKGTIEAIDPGKKAYIHQFVDAVAEGKMDFKGDIVDSLVAKGLSKEEAIAEIMGFTQKTVSQSARTLANQRVFLNKLNKTLKDDPSLDQYSKTLSDLLNDVDNENFLHGWKRIDNIRRGLLVTQLATAQRNAIAQAGRVGLDILEQGMQAGLQRIFGRPVTAHPADAFAVFTEITKQLRHPIKAFKGGISDADKILKMIDNPKLRNRLFAHYASDIVTGGRGKAERAVDLLNTANRFQEWTTRRAVFTAKLRVALKNQGKNLNELINQNRIKEIPDTMLRAAIDDALEFTFAATPVHGSVGHAFVNFINKMPGATFAIPFPRFMVNSMKFFWDFSPAGALKMFSSKEWARMAAGDFKTISRAMIGTGMLGAAWQVRNSEFAGERWYEVKMPGGKTWDTRAFNPFAAYLFVADVVKKAKEGTLNQFSTKDLAMGVLSSNLRAGTGLFILDSFLEGIVGLGTPQKAVRKLKEFAGETVGGFFTPLQTITDLYSEFDENQEIVRDRRIDPFMGPILSRLPVISQQLEPLAPATRADPFRRESGALRQLTGVSLRGEKNPAEAELDRLGFSFTEISRPTGEPEADRLITKNLGPLIEERLSRLVESKSYQRLSEAAKGERVRQLLNKLRGIARKRAKRENPQIFKQIQERRVPRRRRRFLEELTRTEQ